LSIISKYLPHGRGRCTASSIQAATVAIVTPPAPGRATQDASPSQKVPFFPIPLVPPFSSGGQANEVSSPPPSSSIPTPIADRPLLACPDLANPRPPIPRRGLVISSLFRRGPDWSRGGRQQCRNHQRGSASPASAAPGGAPISASSPAPQTSLPTSSDAPPPTPAAGQSGPATSSQAIFSFDQRVWKICLNFR
jgi:hypothetical protein